MSKTPFTIPPGAAARVSIIDSTLRLSNVATTHLMGPAMTGFDAFPELPSWSFLVESSSTGQKVLFDLGVPKSMTSYAPLVQERIKGLGWTVEVDQNVADILRDNGVGPAEISAVIWSHWHWDHIGDITTFPPTTSLVVGPGFKTAFLPGYPTSPDAPVRDADFAGRDLVEVDFSRRPLKAGPFDAVDYFGDGSFYLLHTPGHAIGHLGGLARTTNNPDTFIFMGGDLCHHGGALRPSPHLPLPSDAALRAQGAVVCPGGELDTGEVLGRLNVKRGRKAGEPFFEPVIGHDIPLAIHTIREAQEADAQEDVFFVFAHDRSIRGVVDLFPKTANAWKEKGWREKTLWRFLGELGGAVEVEVGSERH